MFFQILFFGLSLIALQWIFAYATGWLDQRRMRKFSNYGYSLLEHGGMWTDIFVITPGIARVMDKYELGYLSWWGLLLLAATTAFVLWSMYQYEQIGKVKPEAHTHYGKTAVAGWIHGVYAVWGIWVFVLFLITPIKPRASIQDLVFIACLLTVLFPLGVWKFNSEWKWSKSDTIQVVILTGIVWLIVGVRIAFGW